MPDLSEAEAYFERHDSALIVRVPGAEPVIGHWRARFDAAAMLGVPAHVTVLFPFLPLQQIDDDVKSAVRVTVGAFERFTVEFVRVERRSDVVWLRPQPEDGFRHLTASLWDRWPEQPPYGGRFDDIIPHLTIADHNVDALPAGFELAVSKHLPIRHVVSEVELVASPGRCWETVARFPLATPG